MGSINQFLTELGAGTNVKDYQHAARLFVDDNYRLSPKYAWLFHVSFQMNPLSRVQPNQLIETGMLVKSINLPKFSVDTKTYNAYNRVNVAQNKIKYDPVTISFHDDSADVIKEFWYNYYSYYYRDSDYAPENYRQEHKYAAKLPQIWGYTPQPGGGNKPIKLIESIKVYSLHQKRFTEYILINPTITAFSHGQLETSAQGTLENSMTVAYEAVIYNTGYVSNNTVTGFADLHYDHIPSPLTPAGGGTQSILGPGGLLNGIDDVVTQLGQDPPNILGAAFGAFKTYENFKNSDLTKIATTEIIQIGKDVLSGNNPINRIFIPSVSGTAAGGLLSGISRGQQGGTVTPSGATPNQNTASLARTGILTNPTTPQQTRLASLQDSGAATSNGDSIGNAQLTSDPIPPGLV